MFKKKGDLDVITIYGNDTLRGFNNSNSCGDLYLTNNFYLRMGYNIPKKFSESDALKNPFRSNIKENGITTIIRFILCSREFVEKNKDIDLYCEKCYILDDYKFYLNFIDNIYNKDSNGLIINSDHIYLYNNVNDNSVSIRNHEKYDYDYNIIENYYIDFKKLEKNIGKEWNLKDIDYYEISTPFCNKEIKISKNKDDTFNISKDDLDRNKNYIYCIEFAKNLAIRYYNICIKVIEESLFKKNNIDRAFDLCSFLVNNKINNRKVCIYTAICYYYFDNKDKVIEYMDKSDYLKYKYNVLVDFYEKNNI